MSAAARQTEALDALGASFKATIAAHRRLRGRDTQRPGELSYAQYGLLFGLADTEALSTRELALAAGMAPASATQMLDGLEGAGLVTRTRSAQDRRIVLIALSPQGREVIAARRRDLEPRWRKALSGFAPEELETAAAVLDRLRGMFEELAD